MPNKSNENIALAISITCSVTKDVQDYSDEQQGYSTKEWRHVVSTLHNTTDHRIIKKYAKRDFMTCSRHQNNIKQILIKIIQSKYTQEHNIESSSIDTSTAEAMNDDASTAEAISSDVSTVEVINNDMLINSANISPYVHINTLQTKTEDYPLSKPSDFPIKGTSFILSKAFWEKNWTQTKVMRRN